jgi:urease accessory protein
MKKRFAPIAGLAAMAPTAAWAHPGHEEAGGLVAGFWHPLTGADHLVAMVLVGVWAGLLAPEKRAALLIPLGFLGAMTAGFVSSAVLGGGLAEPLILLSLAMLGLAAAFRVCAPTELAVAAAALFGFAHGMAHGFETPEGAFPALFALGFLACTAALHGAGLALARILPTAVVRALSGAAAATALAVAATA